MLPQSTASDRDAEFDADSRDTNKLNEYIHRVNRPCVFRGLLDARHDARSSVADEAAENASCRWTPEALHTLLGEHTLAFRVGKRACVANARVQFENECHYVEATVGQFIEWNRTNDSTATGDGQPTLKRARRHELERRQHECDDESPFAAFDQREYWAYADYKYMNELIHTGLLTELCIDWRPFGFESRHAEHSTLWLSSAGAYTPCHYDTYGYNLVAQIYGRKRWILFPPDDAVSLYPTRIPFEESTVYTSVNVKCPDLNAFSRFQKSRPHVIDLEPGDVLYVPHNWWHFVESLSDAISINTWVELESLDNYARLKEVIAKMLIQGVMDSNLISFESWSNSSESYTSQEDNAVMLTDCLRKLQERTVDSQQAAAVSDDERQHLLESKVAKHEAFCSFVQPLPFSIYLKNYTVATTVVESSDQQADQQISPGLRLLCAAASHPDIVERTAQLMLTDSRLSSLNEKKSIELQSE